MVYKLILIGDLGRRAKGCMDNRTQRFRDRVGRTRDRMRDAREGLGGLVSRAKPLVREGAHSLITREWNFSFNVPLSCVLEGLYETQCGYGIGHYIGKGKG
ncbi:hypothetical protein HOD38_01570 [archaeon]|jgi:hypothetical protein|nr:hypothetical protein [archaeon]MBT4396934.1 hypothetical protein [archaeon]MBT4440925.1 hypothetical protein [archaeon]